jgi:hypothetical protein
MLVVPFDTGSQAESLGIEIGDWDWEEESSGSEAEIPTSRAWFPQSAIRNPNHVQTSGFPVVSVPVL